MRKVITVRFWVDDDWCGDPEVAKNYMDNDKIKEDIQTEIEYCWHNFEMINFETMEISNEKSTENTEDFACNLL